MLYCVSILVYVYYVVYVYLCCIVYVCLYMCMYVGEHSCRPSLLCNPVFDKIDNNNNIIIRVNYGFANRPYTRTVASKAPRGQQRSKIVYEIT